MWIKRQLFEGIREGWGGGKWTDGDGEIQKDQASSWV